LIGKNLLGVLAGKVFKVFNQLGQKIMDAAHNEMNVQLNVSALAANVYMVVVEMEKSIETFKIIVR